MTASLYIHIPFCTTLCDYCDFFSVPVDAQHTDSYMDAYIDAALDDIQEQISLFNVDYVPTAYIGGGTPSALGAKRIERLLAGIQALLKPLQQKHSACTPELSIEANPESADEDFLRACAEGGITRLSMGVQTFHEPSRQAVRRRGGDVLEKRLTLAAAYFPDALSVDLITGLPFQNNDTVKRDIDRVLSFNPVHVSLYSLIIEPETPLGMRVSRNGCAAGNAAGKAISLPGGDEADNLWILGRDMLEGNGLAQYEVSNFALPDAACAHNIRYWRMENWLGIGPAASGTIIDEEKGCGRRYTYPAAMPTYIDAYLAAPKPRIHSACVEELDTASLIRESLLMGFRYREGVNQNSFKRRFGRSVEECIPGTIGRWRKRGFFENGQNGSEPPPGNGLPGNLRVSPNGMLFLNSFLRDAFAELG